MTHQLSIEELDKKLNELRIKKGELLLKDLITKKEKINNISVGKLRQQEEELAKIKEVNLDNLPLIVKKIIEDKVREYEDSINFIKVVTPEVIDNNINKLEERVNFLKVYGI